MTKKGQKLVTYSIETKKKVVEILEIADVRRLKVWMRRYNQIGDFGLQTLEPNALMESFFFHLKTEAL
ncbi:helix-turn-helix domain-containing protein [Paenibacillus sp. FSL A5-0031]|uniref:helix-turn-helix domain-containing protein n=1 Tax=Paenibacillus sp. FSL A5-0031 TaxID=1920420 RepID=UPI001184769E|nr:helix-turn-helix domain-containing protein [Paenibacillus sp. FSL A5-0031]